ncbi:hypothetical protein [Pseudonocardia xishanensis]|uniref:Uncharacterized protein n=1 Tax=Pseudonocardia xishanensis TaxID=630995 RepID=A0ABP8RWP4_9PSEU
MRAVLDEDRYRTAARAMADRTAAAPGIALLDRVVDALVSA